MSSHDVKFKDGVPSYDGSSELFERSRREALLHVETIGRRKPYTAAPRLRTTRGNFAAPNSLKKRA